MKREKIIALLTISALCLTSVAGCSSDKDATETGAGATTTASTSANAAAEDEVEETTPETTAEETEAPLPYVELERYSIGDSNEKYEYDAETFTSTNTTLIGVNYSWTEDSVLDEINHEVYFNGELLTDKAGGQFGCYITGAEGFELNEQGYLPAGLYNIKVYNRKELVFEYNVDVAFDEATAPELASIVRYYKHAYCPVPKYGADDFSDASRIDVYEAGCPGIYLKVMYPGCNSNEGNYVAEWSYNGEAMPDVVYSYSESDEDSYKMEGKFAFEMPDGSPMSAGKYVINFYYEGELFCTAEYNLK